MASIRYSAPGRAGIIGNPSDLYGGVVISCGLAMRARCHLDPADRLTLKSSDEKQIPTDLNLTGDRFDLLKSAIVGAGFSLDKSRFQLSAESDVPAQAGLAGSTAMLTAVVACLLTLKEGWVSAYHLAEQVRRIEADALGVVCGYQDHHMAAFGGVNYMDFRGKETLRADANEPFATVEPIDRLLPRRQELPFVLAFTGFERDSSAVHSDLRSRWERGDESVVKGMREIASLAQRAKKAMIERDWQLMADLMNENHAIVRDLGASGKVLDELIDAAKAGGAWAAKLAGAGGEGGTIIALTPDPQRLADALQGKAAGIYQLAPNAPGVMRI
ncbi:MAG: hypothetical protein HUU60_08620 [Armatimonadetes bacterium]|nr:hypothetical protein [Armatimonadota bacterium]